MALNKEYFDAINIDVVKKKYYNANKVNAVLEDIRTQAEAMCSENASMKAQLEAINGRKSEISDAVLSAQGIYREIVEKAALRAEAIVKDAELKAAEKLREAEKKSAELAEQAQLQQEHSVKHAEALFDKLRRQHQSSLDALNAEWQSFLCGLYPEETVEEEEKPAVPADLSEKVGKIAREMFSIGEE